MKRLALFLLALMVVAGAAWAAQAKPDPKKGLEPFTYKENFESNELNAWASYPLWQDTAFDPNIRPNIMVPGDPNISLVERVTPYTHVDNYAGAQKLLDMVFLEDSVIRLRAYLKTELKPEYLKVRLAAGADGAVDFTVPAPPPNSWQDGDRALRGLRPREPGPEGEAHQGQRARASWRNSRRATRRCPSTSGWTTSSSRARGRPISSSPSPRCTSSRSGSRTSPTATIKRATR